VGRRTFGPFGWNDGAARYTDARGRFVPQQETMRVLDERVAAGFDRLRAMIGPVLDGTVPLEDWQYSMAVELRRIHCQMAALGRGGWEQMTPSDWGRVGNRLRDEYKFLMGFADQIARGELSEAQILARLTLYENGVWSSYWKGQEDAHDEAGFTEERRVLQPAEHCGDCIGYAEQGWQPLGSLPAPGENSICGNNCRCLKEFR
jgi:hypothetical protein